MSPHAPLEESQQQSLETVVQLYHLFVLHLQDLLLTEDLLVARKSSTESVSEANICHKGSTRGVNSLGSVGRRASAGVMPSMSASP